MLWVVKMMAAGCVLWVKIMTDVCVVGQDNDWWMYALWVKAYW